MKYLLCLALMCFAGCRSGEPTGIGTIYIHKTIHDKKILYLFGKVGKVVNVEKDHCTVENEQGKRIFVGNDDEKPAVGDYYILHKNTWDKLPKIELGLKTTPKW